MLKNPALTVGAPNLLAVTSASGGNAPGCGNRGDDARAARVFFVPYGSMSHH